jgi:oligopeptide/dipeptide ABC transporter ATP-binding protein
VSPANKVLVEARGLEKSFERRSGVWARQAEPVRAVRGVDLDVREGEIVGLVGESGSGKSTLGRMLIRLIDPDAGSLRFDGTDLLALAPTRLRSLRRQFQIIFQDPYGSLNPRMRVGAAIGEPLAVHRIATSRGQRREKVARLLRQVGLDPAAMDRFPHEFSGGQRQRIGIARAIACSPRFVVADEPVSALDPPVQAQIINLLLDLQRDLGLAYLLIAHDLRLVEHVCDRVAVMYLGRIVELASAERLYESPRHPYTRALLASTPSLEPGARTEPAVSGEPASSTRLPTGCSFHPRCPIAEAECARNEPGLEEVAEGHQVACHLAKGETFAEFGA